MTMQSPCGTHTRSFIAGSVTEVGARRHRRSDKAFSVLQVRLENLGGNESKINVSRKSKRVKKKPKRYKSNSEDQSKQDLFDIQLQKGRRVQAGSRWSLPTSAASAGLLPARQGPAGPEGVRLTRWSPSSPPPGWRRRSEGRWASAGSGCGGWCSHSGGSE